MNGQIRMREIQRQMHNLNLGIGKTPSCNTNVTQMTSVIRCHSETHSQENTPSEIVLPVEMDKS